MRTQLICTFTTRKNLSKTIDEIKNSFTIIYDKIFILETDDANQLICSYNIEDGNVGDFIQGSILVHRKKDSNTLYTINALNNLIRTINNGVLDTTYRIDWENYKDCLLVTDGNSYRKVPTSIFDIIHVR
jgi:hypothetical protein